MNRTLIFLVILCLGADVCAQRFLLDSTQQAVPRVRSKAVIAEHCVQKKCVCAAKEKSVCEKNDGACGRPECICSPCERIKSDYFRYGPYSYPYIYNQPGFYFGPGIANNHYW